VRRRLGLPTSILVAAAVLFVALPLSALVLRAPWARMPELLSSGPILDAVRVSIVTSLISTVIALALGGPLAWFLVRVPSPARSFVRALALLPLILPPVVGGVALLLVFGRTGIVGRSLGLNLLGTPIAVVMAQAFVSIPLVVLTLESGLRSLDERFEDVSRALGASPSRTLRWVTLPLLAPSISAAALLAWARALGEFGATITFAGNLPGETRTLSLAIFVELQRDLDSAIALSLVLVVVSLGILFGLRDRWVPGA
jgi:molybdate transport system permease protein